MAEYFQTRKSEAPTYHVPTEFPKFIYGGNPFTDAAELKAAIENNSVRSKLVSTQEEQDRLLAKGWVLTPSELLTDQADVETRAIDDEPEFEHVIIKRRKQGLGTAPVASDPDDPELLLGGKTPSPRSQRQPR